MDEHVVHSIIESAQDAFCPSILLRSVRACEAKDNAMAGEERAKRLVVKLTAVVCLERKDRSCKLSLHEGVEGNERGENIRFSSQREHPDIVGVIIKHDQIVLVARVAENGQRPHITVKKTERRRRNSVGFMKRHANMFAKTA